jgi:hypothetical protein
VNEPRNKRRHCRARSSLQFYREHPFLHSTLTIPHPLTLRFASPVHLAGDCTVILCVYGQILALSSGNPAKPARIHTIRHQRHTDPAILFRHTHTTNTPGLRRGDPYHLLETCQHRHHPNLGSAAQVKQVPRLDSLGPLRRRPQPQQQRLRPPRTRLPYLNFPTRSARPQIGTPRTTLA